MKCEPIYTERATRDLAALDKGISRRIMDKVDEYCSAENPLRFARPLKGMLGGLFRFRVGDYRVIFRVDRRGQLVVVYILRIGHRREIYGE